jgi:phage portal protein BeeE
MERRSDGAVGEAYKLRGTNDSTTVIDDSETLHAQSEYVMVTESQDEGTVLGWCTNMSSVTTTVVSAQNIGNIATRIDASPLGSSPLTEAARAAHDTHLVYNQSLDELQKSNRVDAVLRAARSLGTDLPRECFESDVWELDQWVKVQNRLCGHERQL